MSAKFHLEEETLENDCFRKVIWTTNESQLVLMSLNERQIIPEEVHTHTTQFIRIESGEALITVNGTGYLFKDGDACVIAAGDRHKVENIGKSKLKLYTIYSPPEHRPGKIEC